MQGTSSRPTIVGFAWGKGWKQHHEIIHELAGRIGAEVARIHTQKFVDRLDNWEHLFDAIVDTNYTLADPLDPRKIIYLVVGSITGKTKLGLSRNVKFLKLLHGARNVLIADSTIIALNDNPHLTANEKPEFLAKLVNQTAEVTAKTLESAEKWSNEQSAIMQQRMAERKRRGEPIGGNLTDEVRRKAHKAQRLAAKKAYATVAPIIKQYRAENLTIRESAEKLNQLGHLTRNGHPWNHVQVLRILKPTRTRKDGA